MTKRELIQKVASSSDRITYVEAERVINATLKAIEQELLQGGKVFLRGFGTFYVQYRKPSRVRNPRTGEIMMTRGNRRMQIKPGETLRDKFNR